MVIIKFPVKSLYILVQCTKYIKGTLDYVGASFKGLLPVALVILKYEFKITPFLLSHEVVFGNPRVYQIQNTAQSAEEGITGTREWRKCHGREVEIHHGE